MGRAWDCSEIDIPGSPVQFRNEGFFYFFIGKFAQRLNLTKTKRVTEPKKLYEYLDSDQYIVKDVQLVNDETVEIQYLEKEDLSKRTIK